MKAQTYIKHRHLSSNSQEQGPKPECNSQGEGWRPLWRPLTVWPKVTLLLHVVAVLEHRQPSPRNGAGKRLQNPWVHAGTSQTSHQLSFLDMRNKITALRFFFFFLHCSSMFSLYIAKKRRCKIVTGTEEEENMTLVIPAKASQGFQPEIWQFSDKCVARTTSGSRLN